MNQFKNENLGRLLLDKENILPLEELLHSESEKLRKLQKLEHEGRLDFGRELASKEFYDLIPQVKGDVDEFLGVEGSGNPIVSYSSYDATLRDYISSFLSAFSNRVYCKGLVKGLQKNDSGILRTGLAIGLAVPAYITRFGLLGLCLSTGTNINGYSPIIECINIIRENKQSLIQSIGHEYSHYLQDVFLSERCILKEKYNVFIEGHARGVQRYLADLYREREDNEVFLYECSDWVVGELKSAYKWICQMSGKSPKSNLVATESSIDKTEIYHCLIKKIPTIHALGNTLFSLYEAKRGNRIYRDMLQGDFTFDK